MSVVEVFVFLIGRQRPMLAKPRLTFIVIIRDDGRITVKHQVCEHYLKTVKGNNFPNSRSTSLSFCQFKNDSRDVRSMK